MDKSIVSPFFMTHGVECWKGGARESGESGGRKSPSGVQGQSLFVNECTNFDVLEEQSSKTVGVSDTILCGKKLWSGQGGGHRPMPPP